MRKRGKNGREGDYSSCLLASRLAVKGGIFSTRRPEIAYHSVGPAKALLPLATAGRMKSKCCLINYSREGSGKGVKGPSSSLTRAHDVRAAYISGRGRARRGAHLITLRRCQCAPVARLPCGHVPFAALTLPDGVTAHGSRNAAGSGCGSSSQRPPVLLRWNQGFSFPCTLKVWSII